MEFFEKNAKMAKNPRKSGVIVPTARTDMAAARGKSTAQEGHVVYPYEMQESSSKKVCLFYIFLLTTTIPTD